MGSDISESHAKHHEADDFDRDLHPNQGAGQNTGIDDPEAERRTAHDIKELHSTLADFSGEELRSIPVLPSGTRLQQGATYIDLKHLEDGEFTAMANMVVSSDGYCVPKKELDYVTWNRLIGVTNPARLDEAEQP